MNSSTKQLHLLEITACAGTIVVILSIALKLQNASKVNEMSKVVCGRHYHAL